ncbi:unnamed protein product [Vitrella brassicaformis CCMP3155]|uniref:Thioesterase domain-containing protein n=1 Tax=Vitrella brassicaformis (strain CCMP3155) TaxID=1169540 RepID=A0A0G4G9Y3_VITBC|nr:unnamed protein product [Vitrella brassicaformis CCMP3155]|eukprot:CEM25340.1 unnamed protein product [Vitrella brassicaformis CCMP3155]
MAAQFGLWFPSKNGRAENPRFRVLCLHSAGSAETIYTNKGSPRRPYPNPLLQWCIDNEVELLAAQLPGRPGPRAKEPRITSAQEAAKRLYEVMTPHFADGVSYAIVGHSVGTWIAFELLCLIREKLKQQETTSTTTPQVPLPKHLFFSCMVAPDWPADKRPWRQNKDLNEEQFKEECGHWDVNKEVFDMWDVYGPLLRDDFTIFDCYTFTHDGCQPFDIPITAWYAKRDRKISEEMVSAWQRFVKNSSKFTLSSIDGHHLFVYDSGARTAWMDQIAHRLDQCLLDEEYGF